MVVTAEVSKITKSVPCGLTFIFLKLSETTKRFVKLRRDKKTLLVS